jgi:hypothetical protein
MVYIRMIDTDEGRPPARSEDKYRRVWRKLIHHHAYSIRPLLTIIKILDLPDTCSSPYICQWYTSAAGYPGQKFCTTSDYIVTANYGDFCLDYGNTACADTSSCLSKYGSWENWWVHFELLHQSSWVLIDISDNSKEPYCVTVQYAAGPGAVVMYTSYYCSTNTVSRTQVIYFQATGKGSGHIQEAYQC